MAQTEKEIEEHINSMQHPLKRQWYTEAYELLSYTYGYPYEVLSKEFVEGFIDGYVHANSLRVTTVTNSKITD